MKQLFFINVFQVNISNNTVFARQSRMHGSSFSGKTFAFKGDKCQKGKFSKERVTVMMGSNVSGTDKLTPLVIGKSKDPHCFKNIQSLPVEYDFNKKAWMNGIIFEQWVIKLEKKFDEEDRNVILFLDNCPAHKKDVQMKLKRIRLQFFPPHLYSAANGHGHYSLY